MPFSKQIEMLLTMCASAYGREMHENHLHILKEILNNAATFYKRTYIKCKRCKAQKLIRENNSLIFPNIAVIPLLHRG